MKKEFARFFTVGGKMVWSGVVSGDPRHPDDFERQCLSDRSCMTDHERESMEWLRDDADVGDFVVAEDEGISVVRTR